MSKTRNDLIEQVLNRCQVLVYGQSPSDQDVQNVDRIVDGAVAKLAALDIYYVSDAGELGPSGGEIDDAAYLPLADYVASFYLVADERIQALAMIAEKELTTLAAPSRTLRTLRVEPALRTGYYPYYRGGFN